MHTCMHENTHTHTSFKNNTNSFIFLAFLILYFAVLLVVSSDSLLIGLHVVNVSGHPQL